MVVRAAPPVRTSGRPADDNTLVGVDDALAFAGRCHFQPGQFRIEGGAFAELFDLVEREEGRRAATRHSLALRDGVSASVGSSSSTSQSHDFTGA